MPRKTDINEPISLKQWKRMRKGKAYESFHRGLDAYIDSLAGNLSEAIRKMTKNNLSHEDVDRMEDECRMAQSHLEEAGKIVCSVQGETASQIWNRLTTLSNYVADVIHGMYRLRPETPIEQTGD